MGWSRFRLKLGYWAESFVGPLRLGVLGPWFPLWEHLRATSRNFFKIRMLVWSDEQFWK